MIDKYKKKIYLYLNGTNHSDFLKYGASNFDYGEVNDLLVILAENKKEAKKIASVYYLIDEDPYEINMEKSGVVVRKDTKKIAG